jgi:nitrite reductase (cytochrome c-552)
MPDISTKAKAQEYLGLPMDEIRAAKEKFLEEVVPQWIQEAKEREIKMMESSVR